MVTFHLGLGRLQPADDRTIDSSETTTTRSPNRPRSESTITPRQNQEGRRRSCASDGQLVGSSTLPVHEQRRSSSGSLDQPTDRTTCFGSTWAWENYHGHTSDPAALSNDNRCIEGTIIGPNTGSEYHGTSSIIAICSEAATDWVVQQTGNTCYSDLSASIASMIISQLTLGKGFSSKRAPEPNFETAWMYYEAYFQQADSVFRVINRPVFEARLRGTFNKDETSVDDPAWYALRNTVYAAGKRQLLNNNPAQLSFSHIQSQCWPYFENAMTVYSEILFSRVEILGVQALIAMAMFVEGLGSPNLQYMLCASASRLAQSQGLHRDPPSSWNLSKAQRAQRSLLFWTIYAYDKHISLRAGRPSAIDDSDITCTLPEFPVQSGLEGVWLSKVVHHARLSSEVTHWLSTFQSDNVTLRDSIRKLQSLNDQLTGWIHSLPAPLRPGPDLKRTSTTSIKLHINQTIYIHYALHGTIIALNSSFAWPWLAKSLRPKNTALYESQSQKSTLLVMGAARAIIKLTHFIDIDCATPVWLSFYHPLIAILNLFIHILRFPNLPTVQADLALLDIATGYFSRVELATGASMSFRFVRDLSKCAQDVVSKTPTSLMAAVFPADGTADNLGEGLPFEHTELLSTTHLNQRDLCFSFDPSLPNIAFQHGNGSEGDSEITQPLDFFNLDAEDFLLELIDTDINWSDLSPLPGTDFGLVMDDTSNTEEVSDM
ncbi:fungal-specific transcription factor domain-containing protein [Ilyonectria sp. MPI-CAGE-AT-0026]|nr:fungal-specific transcription factor domain-containing protein [Ilyonectria sp. MPI-CAGE-AT-0026]